MDVGKLKLLLGRPVTDGELEEYMSSQAIDVSNELVLKSGDFNAYIERPKLGFSLIFTDESMFLGKEDQPIGKGPLFFVGVFFYSEGKDGYSQYSGDLPGDIKFSDHRGDVVAKMGEPSWQRKRRADGSIAADRWDFSDYRVHVTYSKANYCPTIISMDVPNQGA